MSAKKSVLIYNLYPAYNWQIITSQLLKSVTHNDIFVHISIPKRNPLKAILAYLFLKKNNTIKNIYFSLNLKSKGESVGFESFRKNINFDDYEVATYIHSKGSSRKRKDTQPIIDWTEMLRYFMVERLDLSIKNFSEGYSMCGVNLREEHLIDKLGEPLFPESKFHFSGNFVTINLNQLRDEFLSANCRSHYYGVEVFWGQLCEISNVMNLHSSNINHYKELYPEQIYKTKE